MLSSQGSGKYLSGRWEKERQRAMRTGDVSGEYSQAQLELTNEEIGGVYIEQTYEADTSPIDPLTNPKTRDIRDSKRRGHPL